MLNSLNAEQKSILANMSPVLALGADIANAGITIYVPVQNKDKKFIGVYRQEQPVSARFALRPKMEGRLLRAVEEPVVFRVLQRNISVYGMKEATLGEFNTLRVFPICDGRGKCFAALSFETGAEADDGQEQALVEQTSLLLRSLKSSVADNENYRRMSFMGGVLLVEPNKMIVAANSEARHIFEIMGVKGLVGRRTNDVAINWPLVGMVMDTGIAESKEFSMNGLLLNMRVLPVVPTPKEGAAIVILQDVTELRKKDEELLIKSVVIKEIHHRVKNNLQTIASLLRLQKRRAVSEETKNVLRDCIGRVNSIAIVHEYLSQQDTEKIDVAKVAKGIYQAIISSMLHPDFHLEPSFHADPVELPSEKATSIALILNEMLQNIIDHAFEGRDAGRLTVDFRELNAEYRLVITDDGIGLPENFDIMSGKSLGLKIIKTMAEADLRGSFTFANRAEGGTEAVIIIPKMEG